MYFANIEHSSHNLYYKCKTKLVNTHKYTCGVLFASLCVRADINVFSICKTTTEQGDDGSALNT